MLNSIEIPDALIDGLGWSLLHFVWQGAVIGALSAAMLMAMRRSSANARYLVAVATLALMGIAPIATTAWHVFQNSETASRFESDDRLLATDETNTASAQIGAAAVDGSISASEPHSELAALARSSVPDASEVQPHTASAAPVTPATELSHLESAKLFCESHMTWIVNGWLVGVVLLSLRMFVGWCRVQRLKQRGHQPASDILQAVLTRLIERLKVSRPVQLVESALVEVPTVIGWLKPVILLPATALTGLNADQIEALLAHELGHVRRNDYLINLLQTVIETLLFYHPVVWWLSRRIRIEREHCCDDLAVQVCGDELSYAKTLVALEELRGPRIKLALSADGGSLLGRIRRLVNPPRTVEDRSGWGVGVIAVVVLAALMIGLRSSPAETPETAADDAALLAGEKPTDDGAEPTAADAAKGTAITVASLDAAELAAKMKAAAAVLNVGRMRVEFDKLTDQSWLSGKTDQPLVKTTGQIAWRSDGTQWRADYDGELPHVSRTETSPDQWTSGFDGERLYDFDRDALSLVIGAPNQAARTYTPANLFWNPTHGGLESVLEVLKKPGVKVEQAQLGGLDGYRVERVVENDGKWRWSAFVCPSRGYLMLELQQFFNDQLAWDCKLSDLIEVQPGVWAPQTIQRGSYTWSKEGKRNIAWQFDFKIKELKLGAEEALSWPTYAERTAGFAHPTVKTPYGIAIDDLPRGIGYFNDPWWSDLEPILKEKHDWPKVSLLPLNNLRSNIKEPRESAPSTEQLEKLVQEFSILPWGKATLKKAKPGQVQQFLEGPVYLFVFWAPWEQRSVKALTAAKRLHEEYADFGLKIIAVQDEVKSEDGATILKGLQLPFPSVVDEPPPATNPSRTERLRDLLGVRGMPTAVFIDHKRNQRKIHPIVDASKLTEQIAELVKAAGATDIPALKQDEPLTDEIGDAAKAAWLDLVAKAQQKAPIKGRVVDGRNQPMAAVAVRLKPLLKLSRGGYGGRTVYPDYKGTQTLKTDANGVFESPPMPKGSYTLLVKAGGYAARALELAVASGQGAEVEVALSQPDWISGRVVNDKGQPVKGARIEVRYQHPDPGNLAATTRFFGGMPKTVSQDDGSFRLENLKVGHYTLDVDAAGHERGVIKTVPLGKADLKVWLDEYPEPLQRKVSFKAQRTALLDAVRALCEQAKVEYELDGEGLKTHGLTKNMPLTFKVQDMPLGDALEVMLEKFEETAPLGFAWDGKRVFISVREIAQKRRLPPVETVKGPARERYSQYAFEKATKDFEDAQRANLKSPGTVAELLVKQRKQMVEATQAELELVRHEASQVIGQSQTAEFTQRSEELLITRVEKWLAVAKTTLEIAVDANQKQPGSVPEAELQRLTRELQQLERDLKRLSTKPQPGADDTAMAQSNLHGVVKIEGRIPKLPPIPVYDRSLNYPWRLKAPSDEQVAKFEADRAKNPAKYDPRKTRDESLTIGPRGELVNAVVYLPKAPAGWKPMSVPKEPATLSAEADRFAPRLQFLRVGQQLVLSSKNSPAIDNFHSNPLKNNMFNIMVPKGESLAAPAACLTRPENFPFEVRSDIQPEKRAWILLLDHPFAAVTDAEGRFEIKDLPPGKHQLRVWHERSGYLNKSLEVTVKADQPAEPLALNYPFEKLMPHRDDFMKDALGRPELSLLATWADVSNEFTVKAGVPIRATIILQLRNSTDHPVTVSVPGGDWKQRREVKIRELKVTLESAADAKPTELTIPAFETIRLPLCDVPLDLTGLDAGYWSVQLQAPLHKATCYLTMWIDAAAVAQGAAAELAKTDDAIARAVAYLKSHQEADGSWKGPETLSTGVTALSTVALLQSGVKPDETEIQKALVLLRKVEPSQTYTVALQTIAFCLASPQDDADLIRRNVAWLEKAQVADGPSAGAWSYGLEHGGRGDGSCSRFAVLGLHAAKEAGFEVQLQTWQRLSEYWMKSRTPTGLWGYSLGAPPTVTMTLAGVAGLATAHRYLPDDDQVKARAAAMQAPAEYLEKVVSDWKPTSTPLYAYHCLERAGHVSGFEKFGNVAWQSETTPRLLKLQHPNGSWLGNNATENDIIATSLGLLTLTGQSEKMKAAVATRDENISR